MKMIFFLVSLILDKLVRSTDGDREALFVREERTIKLITWSTNNIFI